MGWGFSGVAVFSLRLHLERGCIAVLLPAPGHPCPQGTHVPGAPAGLPAGQTKHRGLFGATRMCFSGWKAGPGRGIFGLAPLPSGLRGARAEVFPATFPFLGLFFRWKLLARWRGAPAAPPPRGLSSCTLFICMAFNFLDGACVEKQRNEQQQQKEEKQTKKNKRLFWT